MSSEPVDPSVAPSLVDDLALRLQGDSRIQTVHRLSEARMQIEQLIPEIRLRKKAESPT